MDQEEDAMRVGVGVLVTVASSSDNQRPELQQARAFLGKP